MNREVCDKCKGKIVKGRCDCGCWYDKGEAPDLAKILENALLAYDYITDVSNDQGPLTGDHHTGNCIALFKGDHEMCEKVKEYIGKLTEEKKDIETEE